MNQPVVSPKSKSRAVEMEGVRLRFAKRRVDPTQMLDLDRTSHALIMKLNHVFVWCARWCATIDMNIHTADASLYNSGRLHLFYVWIASTVDQYSELGNPMVYLDNRQCKHAHDRP